MSATLLVRDLELETKTALQAQAARNGRSMAAEVRIILRDALLSPKDVPLNAAQHADRFFPPEIRLTEEEARLFDEAVSRIEGDLDPPDFS